MSTLARDAIEAPPGEEEERLSPAARRLLQAASDLFYEQGAVATTVRQITAACGLTPGALYNHFTSKEELLYELVRSGHRRLEDEVAAAQAAVAGDPAAELAAVVAVYVRTHIRRRKGARVANRDYPHLTGRRLDDIVAIRRRLRDRVVGILDEGNACGVFRVAGDGDRWSTLVAAASVLDLCVHCGEWLRPDGRLPIEELEGRFVTMCLRLVGYEPAAAIEAAVTEAVGAGRRSAAAR
ncbi:MAG: TetR family transcriptional regulator [Acidimicrobiales bacterium]